jgi:hypothetical protein
LVLTSAKAIFIAKKLQHQPTNEPVDGIKALKPSLRACLKSVQMDVREGPLRGLIISRQLRHKSRGNVVLPRLQLMMLCAVGYY